jgi:hypothetical protein
MSGRFSPWVMSDSSRDPEAWARKILPARVASASTWTRKVCRTSVPANRSTCGSTRIFATSRVRFTHSRRFSVTTTCLPFTHFVPVTGTDCHSQYSSRVVYGIWSA